MENFEILLIVLVSLAVGAALHEAFLKFTGKLATKPFNPWTVPKPLPKDNWVRDGSKPPKDPAYDNISQTVVLAFDTGQKGTGYWCYDYGYWAATPTGHNERNTNKILAWQKFPDYEKI